ncbi:hypothetical protein [Moraxella bovis]|uniref:Uncharacterized protein n=1 Tax=Moraxella bovis TaxID=476 RepID=A0A378PRC0_MORBO|nr:hypothetical protein [Moraxella bovis]STY91118.1 Uncharacterised protein [Moraxella bovis]
MEFLIFCAIAWFLIKIFSSNKSTSNSGGRGGGEIIISDSSKKQLKCPKCGHNKFLDASSHERGSKFDSKGREYTWFKYTGTCAKCGNYLNEDSGNIY